MTRHENILFVPVPEDSWNHQLHADGLNKLYLSWFHSFNKGKVKTGSIALPPGNWVPIGTTDTMGDKEWGEVLKPIEGWPTPLYYNYTAKGRDFRDIIDASLDTATASGANLLQSLNITTRCVVLIDNLKK